MAKPRDGEGVGLLHDRFGELWSRWGRDGVKARLEYALQEQPAGS